MEKGSLFVPDWTNVVSEGRNELVFEDKHKEYGAYILRREYNKTVVIALSISVFCFLFFIGLPQIINYFSQEVAAEDMAPTEVVVDLTEPPPLDESEPPPPPPPPPPVMETIKFTPPVVVDEEIPDDEIPPPQEKLAETNVGEVTQAGTGGDDIIIPTDGAGSGVIDDKEEAPFTIVELMPSFPGGEEKLYEYLNKNLKFPAMEKENNISGTVFLSFTVGKDGNIKDIKVLRGVKGGPGLEKEAIRVVQNMPDWKPGKQAGRSVPVTINLPVKFVLR